MKTAARPCPICSTTTIEVLHTQHFALPADSPLPASYDVAACPECGFVYADTPVRQSAYDRYYAEFSKYEDPSVATGGGTNSYDLQRLATLARHIAERMPAGARILDVGCAGGGLLTELAKLGFRRLHGADASAACVAQVESLGFAAACTRLSQLADLKATGPFDLIVLSHVLEHVADLRGLMAAAASLLMPDGLIYAETPDATRYGEFPYIPFYFFDSEHINHFDTIRLAALGQRAGLQATDAGSKTLEIAEGRYYPACWAWLGRGTAYGRDAAAPYDALLREQVGAYVEKCRAGKSFPELKRLAASGHPVVVWGAGSFAQRLFGEAAMDGCNIVAIVDRDSNKQGQLFAGYTGESPEEALGRLPDAVVLVAAAVHAEAIAVEARRISMRGEIVTLTLAQQ